MSSDLGYSIDKKLFQEKKSELNGLVFWREHPDDETKILIKCPKNYKLFHVVQDILKLS